MLVHKVCKSQLIREDDKPVFCEVCNRLVRPEEIEVVDDSPSSFSG